MTGEKENSTLLGDPEGQTKDQVTEVEAEDKGGESGEEENATGEAAPKKKSKNKNKRKQAQAAAMEAQLAAEKELSTKNIEVDPYDGPRAGGTDEEFEAWLEKVVTTLKPAINPSEEQALRLPKKVHRLQFFWSIATSVCSHENVSTSRSRIDRLRIGSKRQIAFRNGENEGHPRTTRGGIRNYARSMPLGSRSA